VDATPGVFWCCRLLCSGHFIDYYNVMQMMFSGLATGTLLVMKPSKLLEQEDWQRRAAVRVDKSNLATPK